MIRLTVWAFMALSFVDRFCGASEGHHMEGGGPPLGLIFFQVLNLAVIFIVGIFVLKKSTKEFFYNRCHQFKELAIKASQVRRDAERALEDIQSKIHQLEVDRDSSISRAKQESLQLNSQMVNEASQIVKRISDEANAVVQVNYQKALNKIKEEMLSESLIEAREMLSKDIGPQDHHKLQMEFINRIEAVQ